MRLNRIIMTMSVTVDIADSNASIADIENIFSFFEDVERRFSVFKEDSEISKINRGEIKKDDYSYDMKEIFSICEKTREETDGFFDMRKEDGILDPTGVTKSWAILKAANILAQKGYENFYVDIGGDIEVRGLSGDNGKWKIGIQNPFNLMEIVKTLELSNSGVATSGTYVRGRHIYNPIEKKLPTDEIISVTVVGRDVLEADRFATAVFAMGKDGINFLESQDGLEGYMIDKSGQATMTSNFNKYIYA